MHKLRHTVDDRMFATDGAHGKGSWSLHEYKCGTSLMAFDRGWVAYRVIIRLLLHKLWSHVQWSPFDRCQHHCVAGHCPCKPKVTQLDYTVCTNENILGLHVTMNDTVRVQVVQSTHKLLGYALYSLFWQVLVVLKDLKQLACTN